jgi:DEAD/DEAH box helicase domain-containing protein
MKHVAPVFLLCDPGDLGIAERLRDPTFGQPCLYIYDNYPGGTGLSEGILRNITNVFKGCLDVIANCPCSEGCPSCMGPPDENNKGDFNAKKTVSRFLSQILTANG